MATIKGGWKSRLGFGRCGCCGSPRTPQLFSSFVFFGLSGGVEERNDEWQQDVHSLFKVEEAEAGTAKSRFIFKKIKVSFSL